MEKETYIVTCQSGLENVLAEELKSLGMQVLETNFAMVSFFGTVYDLYKANICLRTALHILKPLKTFNVKDYDILYYQTRKINWHKLFDITKNIRIDVKGKSNTLNNSQYVIHRVKDSILDTFRKFFDSQRPSVDKENPDIGITVYLNENHATIYLDSSGISLFKRGYRNIQSEAPIKEDLAAGILLLSDWDRKKDVFDPMCGTGTFLIEAYMIANNIPPNIDRDFSFTNWFDFDEEIFNKVKEDVKNSIKLTNTNFFGCELDKQTYDKANQVIKKLGFQKNIKIDNVDFRKKDKNYNDIFIITNPPYGERLAKNEDLTQFYKEIGDFLKQKCKNSNASIFTANLEAGKFVGLRTKAKIQLHNGPLEARLLKYELY
ncbi:MAG: hypothetical protein A2Y34_01655 [Spirochaetes bacterium GWC1_27_15]|nr:MAG: hypothetical protein A2Z98_17435 [Spirochaetes bacterium GWB1_27_13]OHD26639.1 MAG: hypothetical protein A2Y34_01655 [Spirochaetes bacterium GWC1_27_15]